MTLSPRISHHRLLDASVRNTQRKGCIFSQTQRTSNFTRLCPAVKSKSQGALGAKITRKMFYYMMGKLGKTELSTFFVKGYEYKTQADIQ